MTDANVQRLWDNFWKDIVCKEDGSIDLEQLKKELYDFSCIINSASTIVSEITNGMLSKPNYDAKVVLAIYEENTYDVKITQEDIQSMIDDCSDFEELKSELVDYFDLKDLIKEEREYGKNEI